MNKLLACLLLFIPTDTVTDPASKIKFHVIENGQSNGYDSVYLVEDLETGTRCYAISSVSRGGGMAISCVARSK